jgi:hypothetical protein
LSTYEARNGEVYRNGIWLPAATAKNLLALYIADASNPDDWWRNEAAKHARALEGALRQAGIIQAERTAA